MQSSDVQNLISLGTYSKHNNIMQADEFVFSKLNNRYETIETNIVKKID